VAAEGAGDSAALDYRKADAAGLVLVSTGCQHGADRVESERRSKNNLVHRYRHAWPYRRIVR